MPIVIHAGEAATRAEQTLELFEVGVAMVRQRLRRERPGASDAEIDGQLAAWLLLRPGAEFGDAGPVGFRLRRVR
ncbi:MAG: hypothetical protein ACRD0X_02235 [Thermoanaerobaculia bacterium]